MKLLEKAKQDGINESILNPNRPVLKESDVSLQSVQEIRRQFSNNDTQFIIIDGFLMYHNDQMIDTFDVRLFLQAKKDVLMARRNARKGYITIDGYWEEPIGYFENYVWPEYLKYNEKVLQDIHGTRFKTINSDDASIEETVLKAIEAIIKSD